MLEVRTLTHQLWGTHFSSQALMCVPMVSESITPAVGQKSLSCWFSGLRTLSGEGPSQLPAHWEGTGFPDRSGPSLDTRTCQRAEWRSHGAVGCGGWPLPIPSFLALCAAAFSKTHSSLSLSCGVLAPAAATCPGKVDPSFGGDCGWRAVTCAPPLCPQGVSHHLHCNCGFCVLR